MATRALELFVNSFPFFSPKNFRPTLFSSGPPPIACSCFSVSCLFFFLKIMQYGPMSFYGFMTLAFNFFSRYFRPTSNSSGSPPTIHATSSFLRKVMQDCKMSTSDVFYNVTFTNSISTIHFHVDD